MAEQRPAPGTRPVPAVRLVVAGVLLAVALAGLGASVHVTGWRNGPLRSDSVPVGIALELILACLLAAVLLRYRRAPAAGQPAAGLRAVLRVFLIIAVLAMPVLVILDQIRPGPPRNHRIPPTPHRPLFRHQPQHHLGGHGGGFVSGTVLLYVLIAVGLALLTAICAALARRMQAGESWQEGEEPASDEAPHEQLRRAVASGQAAMRDYDDARLAIIACYVAMEVSLARAGAARSDAETPDELLARTVADGLVPDQETGTLTELFYEARFSSHPLPPGRREQARHALEVIAAALGRKAAAAARAAAAGTP